MRWAIEFHNRVYDGYKALIQETPRRWLTIDAMRDIETIQSDIQTKLSKRLKRKKSLKKKVVKS